ncbi:MAG TPA: hypothetical protein VKR38_09755 [Usitatibacter sp.]|nr:hypothetical protein [Usitatibacter sp.]
MTSSGLTVQAPPVLTKAFLASTLGVGQTTTLTFTITNPAGAPARTGLTFTDALPAGVPSGALVVAAVPNVANTCGGAPVTATAGAATFTTGATGVNAAVGPSTCTISVDVTSATPGAYTNGAPQVTVGGALVNGVSNQTVTFTQASLNKAFSPSTIAQGGTSTLTFTLANGTGNPAQSGINFTDNLPANVSVAAAPNITTTCSSGTGVVSTVAAPPSITVTGATMSAAMASCVITVDVTSNIVGGPYNNTAANISGTARVTNAVTSSGLTVIAAPTAAKSFAPSTIGTGGTSVLTIVLTNANGTAVSAAGFTDNYPAGLVNTATPNGAVSGAGCTGTVTANAGAASASLVGATIPSLSSCTITVNVTAAAAGAYLNSTGPISTGNAGTGVPSSATLSVFAAPTVTKSFAPTSIPAAGSATMTIVVSNPSANPANLTGVAIGDAYPAGLSNTAAGSVACTAGGSAVLTGGVNAGTSVGFNTGVIPPNGSCTITQSVTTSSSITNTTSTATSTQAPAGTAASASLSVAGAPTISKAFAPASIPLGTTSTITFTLTNANAFALTNGAFTDTLSGMVIDSAGPAGGTCAGAGGNVFAANQTALAFTGLSVPASLSCTVTIVVRGTAIGANPNTTSGVSTTQTATGPVSNTATLTVTSVSPTIAKAFAPATIVTNGVSTLTITIGNNNALPITVTSLTDTFPAGLAVAPTPNLATTCAGGVASNTASSVTLTGGTVPANGTCTVKIDVTSASSGAALNNTIPAGTLTTSIGPNVVAASASLGVSPVADVSVAKTGPASVVNGGLITWTTVISNAGPQAANGANYSDAVPSTVTGLTASCGGATGGAVCGAVNIVGNNVTSTVTTLPATGSVTITLSGTAPQSGIVTNTAKILAPAGTTDPNDPTNTGAGNNSSSVNTTIITPDLRLTKSHVGSFTVGVNGVYTLTVDNTLGTAPTSGLITVTDTLPTGLAFSSATGTTWTCGAVGQVVTCTSPAVIAAGATSGNPITLTVSVASVAVPSVTNQASVSGGNEPPANNANNSAFDPTNVNAASVNTFAPDNAQTSPPGTTVYYAHTFNAGSAGNVSFATTNLVTPPVAGWTQVIYRDTDCSGTLNGAEGTTPLSGAVAVAAGGTVCIIVADNIPAGAPFNAQNVISVTSTFNSTQTITRTDTTTVGAAGGSGLTLAKSVRNVTQGTPVGTSNTAKPGDILEYAVTYTNPAGGSLSAIVITDSTPAFTTFQSASCGTPLPAAITACNVTTSPAVNGTGSVVWTLTGSLAAGGSGTVLYQVRVAP